MGRGGAKDEREPLVGSDHSRDPQGRAEYTVDNAVDKLGFGKFQILMFFYTGMAWTGDAMEMSILAFLGPSVKCQWGLTPEQESYLSSVVFFGYLLGAYSWGLLADERGRRVGFLVPAVMTFAAGVASAISPNYLSLLVFRFFVGLGLGGAHVAFTLFCEFIPTAVRGRYLILFCVFWTLGSILAGGAAWLILPAQLPLASWRVFLLACSVPMAILLLFYPLLPESPHYLVMSGQRNAAEKVLALVAKVNKKVLPEGRLHKPQVQLGMAKEDEGDENDVEAEKFGIVEAFKGMGDLLRLLMTGVVRRLSITSIVLFFITALVYYGIVLLTTSLHTIPEKEDTCDKEPFDPQDFRDIFVVSCSELPFLAVAAFLVETIGRRVSIMILGVATSTALIPLLLGTPLCNTVLGALTGATCVDISDFSSTLYLFLARGAGMSYLQILYVYVPESLPTVVRAFGTGIGNASARVGGMVTPFLGVDLVHHGHPGVAVLVFLVLGYIGVGLAASLPYETKGAQLCDTIEEVEEEVEAQRQAKKEGGCCTCCV